MKQFFYFWFSQDINFISIKSQHGLFQKKEKKQGGLRTYFFENTPPRISNVFTLPLVIPDKTKLRPWKLHKVMLDQSEIPRPKPKTSRNYYFFYFCYYCLLFPHYFFSITLGNSSSFLINPWKFHLQFLWYPWKIHILNPTPIFDGFFCFFWKEPHLKQLNMNFISTKLKVIYFTIGLLQKD